MSLAIATVLVLVAGVLLVTDRLPGAAGCAVEVGSRSVSLSTDQAERGASMAARALRSAPTPNRAVRTLTRALVRSTDEWTRSESLVIARSLTGLAPASLTCSGIRGLTDEPDRLNARGLTARAERVRRDLASAFGNQKFGGFARGGVSTGHMPGSAHYQGRALDVFFRPISAMNRARGWAMAHYLVANADRLELRTVIFDGRIWTAWRSVEGWRDYTPDTSGRSRRVARILEHRDHVHVDVAG